MAKLTDTQLIVLSAAAAREDGLATKPAKLTNSAAAKVGSSLVARKLMREVRARPGMPAWCDGQDGRGISLMITRAGRDAIGVDDDRDVGPATAVAKQRSVGRSARSATKASASMAVVASSTNAPPRTGSKQALVIGMLRTKTGATVDALVEATGWLPHTTRAALTGLRKRGFAIERSRDEGSPSVYRIVGSPAAVA